MLLKSGGCRTLRTTLHNKKARDAFESFPGLLTAEPGSYRIGYAGANALDAALCRPEKAPARRHEQQYPQMTFMPAPLSSMRVFLSTRAPEARTAPGIKHHTPHDEQAAFDPRVVHHRSCRRPHHRINHHPPPRRRLI
jgi:hypothetical protein